MTDLKSLFDPVRSGAAIPPEPMDGLRRRVRRRRNRRRALAAGLASAVLVGGFGAWQTTDGDGDATTEIRTADQPGEAQAAEPTFVLEDRVREPGFASYRFRLGWTSADGPCVVLDLVRVDTQRITSCVDTPVEDVHAVRRHTAAGDAVFGWTEPGVEDVGSEAIGLRRTEPVRAFGGRALIVQFVDSRSAVRIEAPFRSFRDPDFVLEPRAFGPAAALDFSLDLPSGRVASGSEFTGELRVSNETDQDVTIGCFGGYTIGLATAANPDSLVYRSGLDADCGSAAFPAGSETTYGLLIPFRAVDQGGAPLPPGDYLAVVDLGDTEVDPVPVRVTEAEE